MPSAFDKYLNPVRSFWNKSSTAQRVMLGGTLVSLTIIFLLLIFWLNRTEYKVLYANLFPEDASSVVATLKKDNVDYKLKDNGSTILVPANQVYDLRLKVAGEGAMHGQGIGFEIFDQSKIGQTDFVQHINYQRALQGELARTIGEIPSVERARVHLVIPNKSLFIEEQNPPSASVMLKLTSGAKLSKQQVQSIVNLVGSSVEGLDKERVTISDTNGRVLYEPNSDQSLEGLTTSQLEYKSTIEKRLQQRIEQMLIPVVGPGKVIAKVNAELDFSQRTIRKEIFDPDSAVVRSEQKSDEESMGSLHAESGVPEPSFNGEQQGGRGSSQSSTRTSSTTNFEINKEEQSIVVPVGGLERLSVAVLVDGEYTPNEEGTPVYAPRSEEEITKIESLIKSAVGFESSRGDAIEVTNIPFEIEQTTMEEPGLMSRLLDVLRSIAKPLLNALLILLFLLLVVRPLVLAMIRPRVEGSASSGTAGLPQGEERAALSGRGYSEEESLQGPQTVESFKEQAREAMEKNREQALALVKTWLKEGEV